MYDILLNGELSSLKYKVIKHLYYGYLNTVCKFYIEHIAKPDNRTLKHTLSLCLIFKDEAPFLKEWLDYHLTIGVDHFYLYNNNSTDGFATILQPYCESGVVTLIDWPYEQAQAKAYKHCMETFNNESNWIGFIDTDEFICPKYHTDIKQWLKKYAKYPGVCIKWLQFGTSGNMKHDYEKGVIEQYFSCWDQLHLLGKCIVNTRFEVANWESRRNNFHHHTHFWMKIFGIKCLVPSVGIFKHFAKSEVNGKDKRKESDIQINHYYSKAWDCVQAKMQKSDVFYQDIKRTSDAFFKSEQKCISVDYTIMRFFIKMKTKM